MSIGIATGCDRFFLGNGLQCERAMHRVGKVLGIVALHRCLSRGILMDAITMTSEYIEERNGGYYVAGTRVSLDSIVYSFERGNSPEAIQKEFPLVRLPQIYGAMHSIWIIRPRFAPTWKTRSAESRNRLFR